MSDPLNCFSCGELIGYIYSSIPVQPIKCVGCHERELTEAEGGEDEGDE